MLDTNILIYLINILLPQLADRMMPILMRITWRSRSYASPGFSWTTGQFPEIPTQYWCSRSPVSRGGNPLRRTVPALAVALTRYGVLIERPSEALPDLNSIVTASGEMAFAPTLSKEELHPHFNTILINGVGGIRRLAVIAGQIEITPREIQLG